MKLARHIVLISAMMLLVSCATGAPNLVGLNAIEEPLAISTGVTVQNLFVATSRRRSEDAAEFFSGERAQAIKLGNVDVTIPPTHQTGVIEQPRAGEVENIKKHFTIARPQLFETSTQFQSNLDRALLNLPPEDRSVLVFVHGYNTNFTGAVLRMAQFVHDTDFKGVPVLFTWASRGRALDYVYDINSALQARFYLVELAQILAKTKADNFSIVAHSMGNLATLEAMTELIKQDFRPNAELNRVILAAPDVDLDLFDEYVKDLGPVQDKIVVLVSSDDRALTLSRRIAGGVSRVGSAEPEKIAALGLSVIDLTLIDDRSNTNHSKFADSPEIVQLIGRGIAAGNTLSTQSTDGFENALGSIFGGFGQVAVGVGGVLTLGN